MAPVYSLYPSSRQNTPRTMGNDRAQLPSNLRPKASQTSTAMRIPTVQIERASPDLKGAFQEPLVEDFQDRYTSRPYQASEEKQVVATTAAEPEHYTSPDVSDIDDSSAPAPPNITVRGPKVPIPTRKRHEDDEYHSQLRSVPDSSNARPERRGVRAQSSNDEIWSVPTTPDTHVYRRGDRSSGDSIMSQETTATAASIHTLPALQTKGAQEEYERLEPLMEDDPRSFDLVAAPQEQATGVYAMEKRAELLLSSEHLRTIFEDPKLLLKFTGFLNSHRPSSIPILIYYLDALKAIRAIQYANAIAEALEPIQDFGFTETSAPATKNSALQAKADQAFEILVRDDLPAYIAHTWIQVVSVSIQRRITGTLAPHLREASEGLAEVFCLTDPSRSDNPIVFASEEFARTTQYGMSYSIGRNCRFLQGPRTNPNSGRRLAEACVAGKEQTEVFVNYRRDGSPFMNLLMIAPLMDSRGNVRYFIGAQVDVSGLIKDCAELDGLARLVDREQDPEGAAEDDSYNRKDEFQDLSEMFNGAELETVRKYGGRMHREHADDSDRESISSSRPRLLLKDPSQEILDRQIGQIPSSVNLSNGKDPNGRLQGVYQHYLLIRPAPSLRILFTSPSLRVPGILQSPFLHRIGGSIRVRQDLEQALGEGRGVTAKIRWLTRADADGEGEGRTRWIHCTPLLGHSGAVGVWMIVLVDEEGSAPGVTGRRFRHAPPVSETIGGKQYDKEAVREQRRQGQYDVSGQRRGERSEKELIRPGNPRKKSAQSISRPGSVISGLQTPSASGTVSEFSFQLR